MRLQAKFPSQSWEKTELTRYWDHKWFDGLRFDSESELSDGLALVDLKLRYGKSDDSQYLLRIDIKLSLPRSDWQESKLIIEQYKSKYPYCDAPFGFTAHFPHKTIPGLWLMVATL